MSSPKITNMDAKTDSKQKISDDTKSYIVSTLIEPSYKNDINEMINNKKCWRLTGISFETLSKLMVACGGVLSFSSGYFNYPILSFIAGSVSTVSLAFLQFSSFSYTQNKKESEELNLLLKTLDLDTIPVLQLTSSPYDSNSNAKMATSPKNYNDDIKSETSEIANPENNIISDLTHIPIDKFNQLKDTTDACIQSKNDEIAKLNNLLSSFTTNSIQTNIKDEILSTQT